jgi:tRNA (mo5U34)-methyltransferase
MFDFSNFYALIAQNRLQHWLLTLPSQLVTWQNDHAHGDLPRWLRVLKKIPEGSDNTVELKTSMTVTPAQPISSGESKKLDNLLRQFHPWRKGPYQLFDTYIDTEWRSDWKWDRLLAHISPLDKRFVLDVGCGSGYHMWRMLGAGAEFVTGIDPSTLFLLQFEAVRKLANNDQRIHLLPLGIEQMPPLRSFDTVFSMGVLYHRRSPIDHIFQLKDQLRAGGELILETLVVDGDENTVLVPPERYGKMPNVWFLPSAAALKSWMEKCGFVDVKVVDVSVTSTDEQRRTEWMTHESLADYLDPNDPSRTVEGHPAPKRAVLIATNPD